MSNILIGTERKEISKLFELLLWQPDLTIAKVPTLDKLINKARFSPPDLLIIDSSIDSYEHCSNALTSLKETLTTANIPVILLTSPTSDGEEKSQLSLAVDAQISEPFNPTEIKTVTKKFI